MPKHSGTFQSFSIRNLSMWTQGCGQKKDPAHKARLLVQVWRQLSLAGTSYSHPLQHPNIPHLPQARCRPDQQQVRRACSPSAGSWRCLHGAWASSDHLAALRGRLWEEAQAGRGWITRVVGKSRELFLQRTEPDSQGGPELGLSSQSNAPVQPATTPGANSNPLALGTFFPIGSLCHVEPNELLELLNQPLYSHFSAGLLEFSSLAGLDNEHSKEGRWPTFHLDLCKDNSDPEDKMWKRESISIWREGRIPASQRQDMLQLQGEEQEFLAAEWMCPYAAWNWP